MVEKTVTIKNKLGMHARPASLIVQTICKHKSTVILIKDGVKANGRSIMSVMMLAAEKGSNIRIQAEGEDAKAVVEAIAKIVDEKFHEE